jgi:hypothetical protein
MGVTQRTASFLRFPCLILALAMSSSSRAAQPVASSLTLRWERVLDTDPHHILHARLASDGHDVLAISSGGDAWLLSAADGSTRFHETGPFGPGIFSWNERELILFPATDRRLRRIDRESARVVSEIRLEESEAPRGLPVQELDDGTIVSVTRDARVEYWTPTDRKRRTVFRYRTSFEHFGSRQLNGPTVLVLRADARQVFLVVLGVIAVVDLADGSVTTIGDGVRIDPTSVEWSLRQMRPGGRQMLLNNRETLLELDFQARTLTKVRPIPRTKAPKTGTLDAHPFMLPLAVSKDLNWIVGSNGSGPNEPAALLLGNMTAGEIASSPWGSAPIREVWADVDCRLFSAVNHRGAVSVWDWKSPDPAAPKEAKP